MRKLTGFSLAIVGSVLAAIGSDLARGGEAAAAPGVVRGTAKTMDGKPIASFAGIVSGNEAKSGGVVNADIVGKDGAYAASVGAGQFSALMWTDVDYHGHHFRIDLEPADGKAANVRLDSTNGLTKDFVWKLSGVRAGVGPNQLAGHGSHHGGVVKLTAEGRSLAYQGDILENYHGQPEKPLPRSSTVEVTLTPDGPLIDGSTGKPITLTEKLTDADVRDTAGLLKYDIPIGVYKATATEVTAAGERKPLRVVQHFGGRGKPTAPAAEATVEFEQTKYKPNTILNWPDDLNLHVMY